jgi:eukaryotic-like serine/threonine-protein kinase
MDNDFLKQRASAFLQTVSDDVHPQATLARDGVSIRFGEPRFGKGLEDSDCGSTDETIDARATLAKATPSNPSDPSDERVGASLAEGLEFRETLGEGGMGIVRLALQRSVGREVAVKALKPHVTHASRSESDADRSRAAAQLGERLLQEAWITGTLEHPNIVPIYDIGRAQDGSPLIVMRRIAGSSWDKSLDAEPGPKDDSYLDQQFRILVQVANAIEAAHARGIVHRDLKPENVMLGSYGEVYVVDWGIAAGVADATGAHVQERNPNIPVLAGSTVVGTPCYMAPEMLAGKATTATDVYLLAGIAFEIATGRPPHDAETMTAAVASILQSPPAIPAHVDEGLAEILRTCLHGDPARRLQHAGEFGDALSAYLTTRSSVRTTELGLLELAQLEARALTDTQASEQASVAEIEGLLGVARFSFQAALREWPENNAAKLGLERAYLAAGNHALRHGDAERALVIAEGAPADARRSPALLALQAEAQVAAEKHKHDLAALAARGDTHTGGRTRVFVALMTSLVWIVGPCIGWWRASAVEPFPHEVALAASAHFVVWLGLSIWARDSMTKTGLNRSVLRIGFLLPLYMGSLDILLSIAGYGPLEIARVTFASYSAIILAAAIFVADPTFSIGVAFATVASAAGVRWPEHRYPLALLTNAPIFTAAVVLNAKARRRRLDAEARTREK